MSLDAYAACSDGRISLPYAPTCLTLPSTTVICAAGVEKCIISTDGAEGFRLLEAYTPGLRRVQEAEELGKIQHDVKGKGKQRERPKKVRKLVLEACKMHIPKAGIEISTAPTVQGKPKDKLRGLCEKEKKKKQGKGGEKGTNY